MHQPFLGKTKFLGQLLEGAIIFTIDIYGLYANLSCEKGLASARIFLYSKTEKNLTTETLVELALVSLKNNIFNSMNF